MAEHNDVGKNGENLARTFLMKHGYDVLCVNFRTYFGEIDIIAKDNNDKLIFVEVKTVKVNDFKTINKLKIRPEDNLTKDKWEKLVKSINVYLEKNYINDEIKWQIDLACVYLNTDKKEGLVKLIENIHIE